MAYIPTHPKDQRNRYQVHGKTSTLTIQKRDGTEYTYRVSTSDLPRLKEQLWRVERGGHNTYPVPVARWNPTIRLTQYLLGTTAYLLDRDHQNYTRENLRPGANCETGELYIHLNHDCTRRPYEFRLNSSTSLGFYGTLKEAVDARDAYLQKHRRTMKRSTMKRKMSK